MGHFSHLIYEPEKSIDVLKRTDKYFSENDALGEKIYQLSCVYVSIGHIVPMTTDNFFSGHFFPYRQSWEELQIALNLTQFGLYRQAFVSLRCALELGMLSVYYNINDEGHHTVQDWLKSKDTWEANTPKTEKIWQLLKSNENIAAFDTKLNLRGRFDKLQFLSNYVHTKGHKYSNTLGILKSNYQTFEEKILVKWIKTYEEVIIILSTLHLLKYPIGVIAYDWDKKCGIDNPFPVLDEYAINRISSLLPTEYFSEIQEIAEKDVETQKLFSHIKNLPDISEEAVEEQCVAQAKVFIEGMGFDKWSEQQIKMGQKFSSSDQKKIHARLENLKAWAQENNFMESFEERMKKNKTA